MLNKFFNTKQNLITYLLKRPDAQAKIKGSRKQPSIDGDVSFYQTPFGVLIKAHITGLPNPKGTCRSPVFGFHIHDGESCSGNAKDPFANAGTHYNPTDCRHPYHAGDLPPLFGAGGRAFTLFLTDRLTVQEIIGKTIIIHASPDDFTSQPAGNAGEKIACGEIHRQ